MNVQARAATVIGSRVGVKVTGSYFTGNDFALESCDSALLESRAFDRCPDPEDAVQIFRGWYSGHRLQQVHGVRKCGVSHRNQDQAFAERRDSRDEWNGPERYRPLFKVTTIAIHSARRGYPMVHFCAVFRECKRFEGFFCIWWRSGY